MSNFSNWLRSQMNKRNWTNRETSRQAGIDHVTVGKLLKEKTPATLENCTALAKAFGEPVNSVLHIAGLMKPDGADDDISPDLYQYIKRMPADEQAELLEHAKLIHERSARYHANR
jgi:transcriptional regulator with XRE-family HTH domain